VPGATISLLNTGTGVASTKATDGHGNFEFFTVPIGVYKLTAELSGFTPAVADQVRVNIGARQRVDLVLGAAGVSEAVEVTAVSPLLETESSQRGQGVNGDQAVA